MSSIPTPSTPTTREINEQDINEIPDDELLQLDLNPDLDDVQDINIQENDYELSHSLKRTFIDEDKKIIGFDDVEDFQPAVDLGSPFESYTNLKELPTESGGNGVPDGRFNQQQPRRLSLSQQSKFVTYIDDQLLQIQRKFVQSRGLSTEQGYGSLSELLRDFKMLVDFIWYSVDGVSNTDYILKEDLENFELFTKYEGSKSTNFGQTYYLIRISDDLLDYLDKFPLTEDEEDDDEDDEELDAEFTPISEEYMSDPTNPESINAQSRGAHGSLRKLAFQITIYS